MLTQQTKQNSHTGIILAGPKKNAPISNSYEMRAFATAENIDEDPVCGSGSVALARYLQELYRFEETTKITISQGGRLGRDGHVEATIIKEAHGNTSYHVAGHAITVVDGKITL